jgi:hypothetical protein
LRRRICDGWAVLQTFIKNGNRVPGLLPQLAGLLFLHQFLEKKRQTFRTEDCVSILFTEIEIESKPFPIKGVESFMNWFTGQTGVKQREYLARNIDHGSNGYKVS